MPAENSRTLRDYPRQTCSTSLPNTFFCEPSELLGDAGITNCQKLTSQERGLATEIM